MKRTIFAGNWKMNNGPVAAGEFMDEFLASYVPDSSREVWLFPPAASLITVSGAAAGVEGLRIGAQNVYWERSGAFTGEMSCDIAREAGCTHALVGHSERRHVFGETDVETMDKTKAVLDADMVPVLCVGETLPEREEGRTTATVTRQLNVMAELGADVLASLTIAYEPVWAIGTGRNATPDDASAVHAEIRRWFDGVGVESSGLTVMYGGSVKPANVAELLDAEGIDGVLVGGASVAAATWLDLLAESGR